MSTVYSMNKITICYSTHRLETLGLTARIMHENDVIILEEPAHVDFSHLLNGDIDIHEHMLELDVGYPEFTASQYRLLQQMSKAGKQIIQVEPYLDHLLDIQYFLAEGHSPDEIQPDSIAYSVYTAEKIATGLLISYYKEVRGENYSKILSTMNAFAQADAARFVLRDSLRAEGIRKILEQGKDIYIEAGSIHLLLYQLLAKDLSKEWNLHIHSVDRETIKILNNTGNLFNPGDILTLSYIWGQNISQAQWEQKCAQSLIYSKIVKKEEKCGTDARFPHTRNELESIASVEQLSTETCILLFQEIRWLSSDEAAEFVRNYLRKPKRA